MKVLNLEKYAAFMRLGIAYISVYVFSKIRSNYYHAFEVYDNNLIDDILCLNVLPNISPFLFINKKEKHFVAAQYDI